MVEEYKKIVKLFRVHELTTLLDFVGSSRSGRKVDLTRRVLKLLDSSDNELLKAKIDDLRKILLTQTRRSDDKANDENDTVSRESPQTPNSCNLPKKGTSSNRNKMPTTRSMANGQQSNAQQPSTRQQSYDYGILRQNQPMSYNYNNGAYTSYGQHQNMPAPPVAQHTTSRSGSGCTPYLTVVNAANNTDQQVPSKPFEFKSLPFYDVLGVLISPQSLTNRTSSKNQEQTSVFHINADQYNQIMDGRVQKPPSGRFEFSRQVQLRFCKMDTNVGQQDDCFPPGIVVKVNTKMAALPNPMPTNKAGVEPKRPPRPVDVTQLIKLQPNSANVVTINWNCDYPNNYGFTVNLVLKLNSNDLFNRLKSKGFSPNDVTLSLIKEKLRPDDDIDIATESLRVSVTCPLGKMRITTPCRASTCTHIQCFDAMLFLLMNEKKPTWICPICDQKILYSNLIIDGYFVDVLTSKNLSSDVVDIELNENSWRPITKGPASTLSSNSAHSSGSSSSGKQKAAEKITLNNSVELIEVTGKKRPEKSAISSTYIPTSANQIPSLLHLNTQQPRPQSQLVPVPVSAPAPAPAPVPSAVNLTAPMAMKLPSLLSNANPITASGSTVGTYLANNVNQNPTNVIRNDANKRRSEPVVDLVSDSDDDEKEQFVPKPKRKAPLASLVSSKIQDCIREYNINCNRNNRCPSPSNGSPPVITVDSSPSPSNSPVRRNKHDTINTYIDFQMGYDDD